MTTIETLVRLAMLGLSFFVASACVSGDHERARKTTHAAHPDGRQSRTPSPASPKPNSPVPTERDTSTETHVSSEVVPVDFRPPSQADTKTNRSVGTWRTTLKSAADLLAPPTLNNKIDGESIFESIETIQQWPKMLSQIVSLLEDSKVNLIRELRGGQSTGNQALAACIETGIEVKQHLLNTATVCQSFALDAKSFVDGLPQHDTFVVDHKDPLQELEAESSQRQRLDRIERVESSIVLVRGLSASLREEAQRISDRCTLMSSDVGVLRPKNELPLTVEGFFDDLRRLVRNIEARHESYH